MLYEVITRDSRRQLKIFADCARKRKLSWAAGDRNRRPHRRQPVCRKTQSSDGRRQRPAGQRRRVTQRPRHRTGQRPPSGSTGDLHRITSYNVCYTKLLRATSRIFSKRLRTICTEFEVSKLSSATQLVVSLKKLSRCSTRFCDAL